jgi:hypothetical protein
MEVIELAMEEERLCIACGAGLVGPFEPSLHLAGEVPEAPVSEAEAPGPDAPELAASETDAGRERMQVSAYSWICPGCGLVQWYVQEQTLEELLEMTVDGLGATAQPDTSYERRSRMLRMLRRVQRM